MTGTRALMMASAAMMAVAGVALTFAPQEIAAWAGPQPSAMAVLLAQAAGALYIGFAVLNWMAKDVVIGGIYSRPVAIGNSAHFFILAAALVRLTISAQRNGFILLLALVYAAFAVCFGVLLFTSPRLRIKTEQHND
jgi:hypothetical protein